MTSGDEGEDARLLVADLIRVYKTPFLEVVSLRGVNIRLGVGESLAVIGPSGSGKTTLLNLIGGLDRPTAGRILFDGIDITQMGVDGLARYRREKVGFVFQSFNLVPHLSAKKNIELAMMAAATPRHDRRRRAEELLDLVDLSGRARHRPRELSGGEQQRVAIAAALANDPPLILADEPTGELDTETGSQILGLFAHLAREMGKSEIIVTHDLRVGSTVDRVLAIEDGRIRGETEARDLGPVGLENLRRENAAMRNRIDRLAAMAERSRPEWEGV